MVETWLGRGAVGLALTVLAAFPLAAQGRVVTDVDWCRDAGNSDRGVTACEVREFELSGSQPLRVDAAPNGSIRVEGGGGSGYTVRVRVTTHAEDDAAATAMLRQVRVRTDGNRLDADGPRTGRRAWWSASYRVQAPRTSDLDLRSTNGGIAINDVHGTIRMRTVNGGITLSGAGGDVEGRTTNGGIHADLAGSRWDGTGLDLQTTNGGVRLTIPEGYSASLETGTVNGSLQVDFPVTVQGRVNRDRLTLDLGEGGPPVRVVTTNGSVHLRHGT